MNLVASRAKLLEHRAWSSFDHFWNQGICCIFVWSALCNYHRSSATDVYFRQNEAGKRPCVCAPPTMGLRIARFRFRHSYSHGWEYAPSGHLKSITNTRRHHWGIRCWLLSWWASQIHALDWSHSFVHGWNGWSTTSLRDGQATSKQTCNLTIKNSHTVWTTAASSKEVVWWYLDLSVHIFWNVCMMATRELSEWGFRPENSTGGQTSTVTSETTRTRAHYVQKRETSHIMQI